MAHAWKACWVQALGGSNPPSSATEPRNLPRFRGFVACAPPDLLPPRVLPARESSAPRASLGASARCPARPRRPRGGLQSGVPVVRVLLPWLCCRPRAPQPGPTTPACHMRPQPTDAIARLCSLRGDRRPGVACLAGPRPRPFRPRDPRRSPLPGARRGPRPSRTASSGAGPSRCSSSRPRTPNQ